MIFRYLFVSWFGLGDHIVREGVAPKNCFIYNFLRATLLFSTSKRFHLRISTLIRTAFEAIHSVEKHLREIPKSTMPSI